MNVITKIARSLSFIALVIQPLQATPSQAYTKKAAKIAAYLVMIGGGILGLRYSAPKYQAAAKETKQWTDRSEFSDNERSDLHERINYLEGRSHPRSASGRRGDFKTIAEQQAFKRTPDEDKEYELASAKLDELVQAPCAIRKSTNAQYKFAGFSGLSAALITGGLYGLKKELCPDFKPIEWIKNKIGINTKKTEPVE